MTGQTAGLADAAVRGMTRDEILSLPVTVDVVVAGRAIGIGRAKAYELVRSDQFPVRVLHLGRRYRVASADLRRYLGIDSPESE